MDRAERTGLGVAVAGHAALFGLLSVGFLATPNPLKLKQEPIEVTLSEDVALQSASPTPDAQPPVAQSPDPAEIDTPDAPAPQPQPQPVQRTEARPQPSPVPQPKPKPQQQAKPAPAKPAPRAAQPAKQTPAQKPQQRRGNLGSLVEGITDKPRAAASTGAPAATLGPAQQSALANEIRRQIRPRWQGQAPTGADAELLRTILEVRLARDGSIMGEPRVISQTGINDSNRGQAALHKERAIRAIKLAAPFKLPPEFYDAWKIIKPVFDKRLG